MKRTILIAGAAVLAACLAAYSAQVYANHVIRKQVEEYSASLLPDVEMTVEKCRYSLIGRSAHFYGVSIVDKALVEEGFDRINMDEVVVYRYDTENMTPNFADLIIKGIAIPDSFAREIRSGLEQIGLSAGETSDLKIDFQSRYHFDPVGKELKADRNDMQIRGLAGFKLKFHLVNIDPALFRQQPGAEVSPFILIAAIGNIRLVSADMFLEIGELADKVFDGLARKNSISVAQLKEKTISRIEAGIRENPGISAAMGERVLDFIREPGDMKITLSPGKPVSVLEVLSMSEHGDLLARELNVRIEKL
jgi:hypothetical protein